MTGENRILGYDDEGKPIAAEVINPKSSGDVCMLVYDRAGKPAVVRTNTQLYRDVGFNLPDKSGKPTACYLASIATIWYVVPGGAGTQDGMSWANAFAHPNDAVDVANIYASRSQEIWVKEGTYTRQGADTYVVYLKQNVEMYGGFAGTENARGDRNWVAHVTILDGENICTRVVIGTAGVVLDGFEVKRGNGSNGAGVQGVPIIRNCNIHHNSAVGKGGGVYFVSEIENCKIEDNQTTGPSDYGGGIYVNRDLLVINCDIKRNTVQQRGAGIFFGPGGESLVCQGCVFQDNVITVAGATPAIGAGACMPERFGFFKDCTFTDNLIPNADDPHGGAAYTNGAGFMFFENAAFSGNTPPQFALAGLYWFWA